MENVGCVIEPMVSVVSSALEPAVGVTETVVEVASESIGGVSEVAEPIVDAAFAMAPEVPSAEGIFRFSEQAAQDSARLAFARRQLGAMYAVASELSKPEEDSEEEVVAVLVEKKMSKKQVAFGLITGLISKIAGFVRSAIMQT